MANRHTLHISKIEDFKEWLVKDGWEIEEPKGTYEYYVLGSLEEAIL